jgi:hypothetical protein
MIDPLIAYKNPKSISHPSTFSSTTPKPWKTKSDVPFDLIIANLKTATAYNMYRLVC